MDYKLPVQILSSFGSSSTAHMLVYKTECGMGLGSAVFETLKKLTTDALVLKYY